MIRSFFLMIVLASAAHAEEIPLKSVWALNMPSTQNVRELPSAQANQENIEAIRKALLPKAGMKAAQRGFAVSGQDADVAMGHAYEILVDGKKAAGRFSADEQFTASSSRINRLSMFTSRRSSGRNQRFG